MYKSKHDIRNNHGGSISEHDNRFSRWAIEIIYVVNQLLTSLTKRCTFFLHLSLHFLYLDSHAIVRVLLHDALQRNKDVAHTVLHTR